MVKIWELTQSQRWRGRARAYDLVVFDAPATGHALGMLSAPRTFGAIARVGAVARQAERVQELLRDSSRTSYVAVAHAAEMAVTETLELQGGLRKELGRELAAVIVNCVLPRRFSEPELRRLASLNDDDGTGADGSPAAGPRGRPRAHGPAGREPAAQALVQAASAAARSVHERARFQHNQIARLRRRRLQVIPVPFRFAAELDLAAVRGIASQIGNRL
jgi:anion-transporting  ArsA/GET3 family ATPase